MKEDYRELAVLLKSNEAFIRAWYPRAWPIVQLEKSRPVRPDKILEGKP